MLFRERFEVIIKTDGEDSGLGAGYSQRQSSSNLPPPHAPPPAHLATGHPGVVPVQHGYGGMDEKQQMWRNEKAIGAMV